MADDTQLAAPAAVPEEQMRAAFDGPAPIANKILLTLTPATARLAFLELEPGDIRPRYRAAVTLSISDLVHLQNLLNRMLTSDRLRTFEAGGGPNAPTG